MKIRELSVPDAYEVTPRQHGDNRGVFLEWFRFDRLEEEIGHKFDLRQANTSVSNKGVVRGIHFADIPPGQAKYVTCPFGAVLDYVIDIRVGSPTFGRWDAVLLDGIDRKAIYIGEGLGHAFVALQDNSVVTYLVSDVFNASREHGINPLDPEIGLEFPEEAGIPSLSPKDIEAPTLSEAQGLGLLPNFSTVKDFYSSLSSPMNEK